LSVVDLSCHSLWYRNSDAFASRKSGPHACMDGVPSWMGRLQKWDAIEVEKSLWVMHAIMDGEDSGMGYN